MCNRYGFGGRLHQMQEEMSQLKIPLRFEAGRLPNLEPREHIRPTNTAVVLRPLQAADPGAGLELTEIRWDLVPFFHKGPLKAKKYLCTNARAETVAATAAFREPFRRRRCLVPVSHFFEWTGPKGGKTMWKFTHHGRDDFCFAGLWDRAHTADGEVESFTILTTAAGPDAAPYHDRQPVILAPDAYARWLDLAAPADALLASSPAGALKIEQAAAPQA